jgi:hypothetical protein
MALLQRTASALTRLALPCVPASSAACMCTGLGKGFGGNGLDDVMNTDELVGEEDIEAALEAPAGRARSRAGSSGRGDSSSKARAATPPEGKQAAASLLRSDIMSARERNKLKRKAKALGRQDSIKPGGLDAKGRVSSSRAAYLLLAMRLRAELLHSWWGACSWTAVCLCSCGCTCEAALPVCLEAWQFTIVLASACWAVITWAAVLIGVSALPFCRCACCVLPHCRLPSRWLASAQGQQQAAGKPAQHRHSSTQQQQLQQAQQQLLAS